MVKVGFIGVNDSRAIASEARNLAFAGSYENPISISIAQNDSARFAQSHSLFSAMRVCTIFFSSESGKGLADGNRIVPLEVGKPSSSFSNFSITPDPVGKRLQWFLNAAYPTSIPLYSNIGIP